MQTVSAQFSLGLPPGLHFYKAAVAHLLESGTDPGFECDLDSFFGTIRIKLEYSAKEMSSIFHQAVADLRDKYRKHEYKARALREVTEQLQFGDAVSKCAELLDALTSR